MNALLLSPEELSRLLEDPDTFAGMIDHHERRGSVFMFHEWVGKLHEALTGLETGGDPPLAWAVHGGQELDCGGVDALALTHAQVRTVDKGLRDLGEEGVRRLIKHRLETGELWTDGVERMEPMVARILPAFRSVALVYAQAAKEGFAVVKYYE